MIATIHAFLDEIKESWERNILNKGIKPKRRVTSKGKKSKKRRASKKKKGKKK